MAELTLRQLKASDREPFLSALAEPWGDFVFAHYYESVAGNSFETYVEVLPEISRGLHIPADYVPSTLLFAFSSEGKLVGQVSIRHRLTEGLLQVGGHIGYGVAPSERGKGYATEILKKSLRYVRENFSSLERVLLTCDDSNSGSIRVIERNGGVLENVFQTPEMAVAKRRYWISLR